VEIESRQAAAMLARADTGDPGEGRVQTYNGRRGRLDAWDMGIVRVFEAEPELLRGVDPELAARLRRQVVADLAHVPAGMPVAPELVTTETFAVLVLDGMLACRVQIACRRSVELLGAGDVLQLGDGDGGAACLPADASWRALRTTRIALLDPEFLVMVHRAPAVVGNLLGRVVERCRALAVRLAIAQMPRLDARLLALFWHLADRWGRVEPGRVTIPLPLSHALLADLVCAQRPSVSVVLKHLIERGEVERLPLGGWALFTEPPVTAADPALGEPVGVLVR
jgi:CRP/FNR family transcriptional regulator, cyclic AMP receptor protein